MTVELRPMGVACNLGCTYCYQEPMRKAGNINTKYDIKKMLEVAEATGQSFSLFGGEALLIPKKDLEIFFKRGYELHGYSGLQTNGVLIDDDHIELFKKYNVGVGVSIDGPNELNGLRKVRGKMNDDNATLDATKKIMSNIQKLVNSKIQVSIIITLHQLNGSEENLPRLLQFMRWLGDIGVKNGNIHTLEVDKTMPDQDIHVLSQKENAKAFVTIANFLVENPDLSYNPFEDIKRAMTVDDSRTICTWNNCDPLNTSAVYGIEGDGGLSNCGRTNKEGIDWYKTEETSFERYISLYHTPQNLGGCQGCRFFMLCGGSCPGEALENDFRNKTLHCHTQKVILGYYEKMALEKGITPFSKREDLKELENVMMNGFMNNQNVKIMDAINTVEYHKRRKRFIEIKN